GLWLLDTLRTQGISAVILENAAIGAGQTIWSQGIIHGGAKYTLRGLSDSLAHVTKVIADMPSIWSECLEGKRLPNLTNTRLRAPVCHLWRTAGISSWAGVLAAGKVLKTPLKKLDGGNHPTALRGVPG